MVYLRIIGKMPVRDMHKTMLRQFVYMKFFDGKDMDDMQKKINREIEKAFFSSRRKNVFLLLSFFFAVLYICSWLLTIPSERLMRLPAEEQNYDDFNTNRSLEHHISNIHMLIDPSSAPCAKYEEISLIVLVSSGPHRFEHRQSVRLTWGRHQRTYFVLGFSEQDHEKQLADYRLEAKQYNDMIVFDFYDYNKNSTLKTALMMYWTLRRCPQAEFMLKTVDDVLMNPWVLRTMLIQKHDSKLLGYVHINKLVFSEEYNKWYLPRWLYKLELVPQYLAGSAYLIHGDLLPKILNKAYQVPIIPFEDIYFTYIVAYKNLGLSLRHDWRLNPKRPVLNMACAYWSMASTRNYSPTEMVAAWTKIEKSKEHSTCNDFITYLLVNEWLLI